MFENTRVASVNNIYIYFAKLTNPAQFKYRSYSECLYDIAVTHSPRYLIDMNLKKGESIFDKMNVSYDCLRGSANPVKPFIEYFKKNIVPGEEPWWINSDERILLNSKFFLFSELSEENKNKILIESMAFFPEIFGNNPKKYHNLARWLAARHGIVDSSLRDRFSAGGQVNLKIGKNSYSNIPRIYKNLQENADDVIDKIKNTPLNELQYYWGDFSETNVLHQWSELFLKHSRSVSNENEKFLVNLIGYTFPLPKSEYIKEKEREYGLIYKR